MKIMKLVKILLALTGFVGIGLDSNPCNAQRQDVGKGKVTGGGKAQDLPVPISDHSIKEYLEWVSSKWGHPIDGFGEKGYGKPEVLDVVSGSGFPTHPKLKTHMWDNAQNAGDIVAGWRFRVPIKDSTGVKTTNVASGFMSELLGSARPIHLTAITEFGYDSANKVNFIYVYFDCNNDLENRFQLHELEAKSTGWKVPKAGHTRHNGTNYVQISGLISANQITNLVFPNPSSDESFASGGSMPLSGGGFVPMMIRSYGYPFQTLGSSAHRVLSVAATKSAYSSYPVVLMIGKLNPNWRAFFPQIDPLAFT